MNIVKVKTFSICKYELEVINQIIEKTVWLYTVIIKIRNFKRPRIIKYLMHAHIFATDNQWYYDKGFKRCIYYKL